MDEVRKQAMEDLVKYVNFQSVMKNTNVVL